MADRPQNPYDFLAPVPSFTVTSTDIQDGGTLPEPQRSGIFDAGGSDTSPHLAWSGFPEGTRGFVVTCYDPDAPTGSGFWHWAVYGIPVSVTELPTGAGSPDEVGLPEGAVQLRNDASLRHYLGAAPPPGHGPHRYFFVVHAVDTDNLEMVTEDSTPGFLGFILSGHTLARGAIVATFER
ncbi:MAG TPA: YbhB/YbcL family Raf kinase inhibitor-like protein [Actinomycetes bacterium]|nr:YbhB/YbcL family Raf kinase inhibitor-like protein [Actinomycetes bacterium]